MRKLLSALIIVGLVGCLAVCKGPSAGVPSVEKTSFDAVTSKLDKGGSVYVYISAEKIAKAIEDFAAKLRTIVESQAGEDPAKKEEILGAYDFVVSLIKKFGLSEISGIGVSSVAMTEDLHHSKFIVHHPAGQADGILWQLWEDKPHELTSLKLLPADTVLAQFADCRLSQIWQILQTEAEASGIPALKKGIGNFRMMLDAQGIPFDAMLGSLSGSMGFLLTLDKEKTSTIPLGQAPLEIREPGLAIVLGVKDDTIFDFISSKMAGAEKIEDQNIKRLRMPAFPLPIPIQPEIVRSGDLLILASHGDVTDAMLSARDQGNGLTATQEFKDLSRHIPEQGNSFRFVGPGFSEQILDIQKATVQASVKPEEGGMAAQSLFDIFPKGSMWYAVLQNTNEGLVTTFNHSQNLEMVAMLSAVGAVGAATAIIIPNVIKDGKK